MQLFQPDPIWCNIIREPYRSSGACCSRFARLVNDCDVFDDYFTSNGFNRLTWLLYGVV